MLTLRDGQMRALEEVALVPFARQLRPELAARYPHFLPRFPEPIQEAIIDNMLGRARLWGLRNRDSLQTFCQLMIAIGANFDQHPDINWELKRAFPTPDLAVMNLPGRISDTAWKDAEVNATDLPFFIPAHLVSAPLHERTSAALPVALYDFVSVQTAHYAVQQAMQVASQFGLSGEEDSALIAAAWRGFYGSNFQDRSAHRWLNDVICPGRGSRQILRGLKLKIAIDYGRFI
jgi:hypothetical protein